MRSLFNLFILGCITCSLSAQNAQNKERVIIAILNESSTFEQIKPVIPILRKYRGIYRAVPLGNPIEAKHKPSVTGGYGYRTDPLQKTRKFHSGIDLQSEFATIIRSTAAGTVIFAGKKGGYGKCVIIEHKYGFSTLYGHLTVYYTKKGKRVKKGDAIGFLGSTGRSTGNHLHYEIEKNGVKINPEGFLEEQRL